MTLADLNQPLEHWKSSPNPAYQRAPEKGKLNSLDFSVAPKRITELSKTLNAVSNLGPFRQVHKGEETQLTSLPRKPPFTFHVDPSLCSTSTPWYII